MSNEYIFNLSLKELAFYGGMIITAAGVAYTLIRRGEKRNKRQDPQKWRHPELESRKKPSKLEK